MSSLAVEARETLAWLLEEDDPGVRYLALRDLVKPPPDAACLERARRKAHESGPIAAYLDAMETDGYWVVPGHGYNPKYRSTVWSITALAQLGARLDEDDRLRAACAYVLDHALTARGQFTTSGAPSGTVDCLQGNLCWALLEVGSRDDRLVPAFDWLARSVTGDGVAPAGSASSPLRYYAYKCGPGFRCGANNQLPCAWGAAKVLLALAGLPAEWRTARTDAATRDAVDFLLCVDPASAAYPTPSGGAPNRSWWKLGFPVFYVTDLLQVLEALVAVGHGADPRLEGLARLLLSKTDRRGRWSLEYSYAGKTWADFGPRGEASKWVTWRALRALGALPRASR